MTAIHVRPSAPRYSNHRPTAAWAFKMAFPSTLDPGFRHVGATIDLILQQPEETLGVEFKDDADWPSLKYAVIRTCMAMANLRDGGHILVGISGRDTQYSVAGVSSDNLLTYDPDLILAAVAKYASPPPDVRCVIHETSNATLLCIRVSPFINGPVICKKEHQGQLRQAAIYLRLNHPIRSAMPVEESQIRAVIDLAAERRAQQMVSDAARIGALPPAEAPAKLHADAFDEQLGDFR
jgi:Schlafen, AlbA_2